MRGRWAALVVCVMPGLALAQGRPRVRPARVCVPGAQVACGCVGGGTGAQVCNASGVAFGACVCPDVVPPLRVVEPRAPPVVARPTINPVRPAAQRYRTSWYGWQILIVDAVAGIGSAIGGGTGSTGVLAVAGGTYLLGPAVVHMVHGDFSDAALSFALRAVPVGFFYYASKNFQPDDFRSASIAALVFTLGVIALDVGALSTEKVPLGPQVSAGLVPFAGGGLLGVVGGRF